MKKRLLVPLVLSLTAAGPGLASNFGSSDVVGGANELNLAQDSAPLIARLNLRGETIAALDWVVANVVNPTDLSGSVVGNQTQCADSLGHDVCLQDNDYGATTWRGITECVGTRTGSNPDRRCSRQQIRLNDAYFYSWGTPAANTRSIVCHEMGHAFALRHKALGAGSCMPQGYDPPDRSTVWDAHDVAHVNAHY